MSTENNNNKEKKIGPPSLFLSAQPSRARGNTQAWSACPWLSATAVRCLWPHDTRRFSSESRTVSWSRSTARANAQPSTRQPAAGNHEAMQRGWPCAQVFTAPYLHPTLSVAQATLWQAGLDHFQVRAESVQIWALKLSAAPAVVQSNAVVPVCASGIVGARPEVGNDPYFEPKNVRALEPRDQQTQPSHCPMPVSVRCRLLRSHVQCERRSMAFASGVCPHRHPLQGWRWGHLHGGSGGARRSPDLEHGPIPPRPVRG